MLKKHLLFIAVILAVLFAGCVFFSIRSSSLVDLLEPVEFQTGTQNSSLGYDSVKKLFLIGTYTNQLIAFDASGKKIWTFEGKGPFRQLIVHSDSRVLYAGNEDNHVYILNLDTGRLAGDINAERRIYNIDVNSEGSEILISAGVSVSKHNILLYNAQGEQLENIQFTSRIQGAAYAPDNSNIILVNNRGEVLRIDRNGKEIASQRLLYELVDLKKTANNEYLVLSKPGSYHIFDGNLNIMREKMVNESFPVTGRTVGSDTSGQYTVIGTNEGFLYFFDKNDNQIFSTRVENGITDFLPIGEDIYLTGLGDFVYKLPAEGIRLAGIMSILKQPLVAGSVTLAVAALFCVLFALGATRSRLIKFGIIIYRHRVGYLLILPTFVLLVFFNYSSIFLAFTRAFTNWSRIDLTWATMKFIGFDNFREMLHDRYFFVGIKNLVLLMVTAFAKLLTVPLIVAWLVYSMKINRQKTLFRFLFVLPMVVPGVVSALMWKQIYDPSIGLINQFLTAIGLENWRQVWLGNEKLAIWSVIFMGFPFVNVLAFLVYYGGLMDIDPGIIESARIDGAGKGKIFFNIQLPILLSQIKVLAILTFIGTMQDYGGIYLLTGGGPGSSTYVPGLQLYYSTASTGRYGYACALGIVLFIFTMIGTLINMKMKTHSED